MGISASEWEAAHLVDLLLSIRGLPDQQKLLIASFIAIRVAHEITPQMLARLLTPESASASF